MVSIFTRVLALAVLALALGCSDNSTDPQENSLLENLEGSWELISITSGPVETEVGDGQAYWYFSQNGESCTLSRTAYGEYLSGGGIGVVLTPEPVLVEGDLADEYSSWGLSFSANRDTLFMDIIESTVPHADRRALLSVDGAPEATCF